MGNVSQLVGSGARYDIGRNNRARCTVTCATGPPPAWPGRAPVPDSIMAREGPKVRMLCH